MPVPSSVAPVATLCYKTEVDPSGKQNSGVGELVPDLMMESQERGEVVVIYPRGFINAHTVREFEQELERSVESGRTQIVINGSGLSYIASAGLGVIMGHIEEVRSRGATSDSRISTRRS